MLCPFGKIKTCMQSVFMGIFILLAVSAASLELSHASEVDLDAYVSSLQKKYSTVRDLRMDFIQTYRSPRRTTKTETGILFLRRPGMMRWEYQTPKEKLFVSNGKTVYFYLPEEHQVQKGPVKESRDQRVPFLFLLGRGNLKKDFSKIEWALDNKPFFEGNKVIYAYPKKNIDEFSRILMEFNPQRLQLQRVAVYDLDGSTSEFVFTGVRENIGIRETMFQFKIPPNVEVVGSDLSQP